LSITKPVDVLTFGEAMMSLRSHGPLRLGRDLTPSVAGAESNAAICLARLGHHVRWVGILGDDEPGALVLRTLRAEAVDVTYVKQDADAATGLILFDQPLPQTSAVTYYRTGSAGSRLTEDDLAAPLQDGARILHVTGITCAISESAAQAVAAAVGRARSMGITVCLDVNYRSRLWTTEAAAEALAPLAAKADIVIGSAHELALLKHTSGDRSADDRAVIESLLELGVAEVVTKLGANGAQVDTTEGTRLVHGHHVRVIDPVGAGDAFCAGYISARLDGEDLDGRLNRANALGATVVGTRGDWEGAPRRNDLKLFGRSGAVFR